MKSELRSVLVALVCALLLLCCARMPGSKPPQFWGCCGADEQIPVSREPSTVGTGGKASLLVRAFLIDGEHSRGFAFYSYLVFSDASDASAAARLAAAKAYTKLLQDVSDAPTRLRPKDLAVLYAPVNSLGEAKYCLQTKDPKALLESYDYAHARLLANAVSKRVAVPKVALVGSEKPIVPGRISNTDAIYVVDLDTADDAEVQRRLHKFRDALERGEGALSISGTPTVLLRARKYFRLFGQVVMDLSSIVRVGD